MAETSTAKPNMEGKSSICHGSKLNNGCIRHGKARHWTRGALGCGGALNFVHPLPPSVMVAQERQRPCLVNPKEAEEYLHPCSTRWSGSGKWSLHQGVAQRNV